MIDVCLIGPTTKDIIRIGNEPPKERPGGVPHYAGAALKALGLKVAVITKHGMVFENTYAAGNPTVRTQRVLSISKPFSVGDLIDVRAKAVLLGPLLNTDMDTAFIKAVKAITPLVALDVQGFMRRLVGDAVQACDWEGKREALPYINILKADEAEAMRLSGKSGLEAAAQEISRLGPKEVLITRGGLGSLVYAHGKFYEIPAYPPAQVVDTTGCGDTYLAGYLFARLKGQTVADAAHFASKLAGKKAGLVGPITSNKYLD